MVKKGTKHKNYEFCDNCDELYADRYDEMKDRDGVCEAMFGLEYFMDSLLDYIYK